MGDVDNACAKAYVDGLVDAGALRDDADIASIETEIREVLAGEVERVVIVLTRTGG